MHAVMILSISSPKSLAFIKKEVEARLRKEAFKVKLIRNAQVREILQVSQSKASEVIRELQAEMKEQGYMVIEGRIPEEYLRKRFMLEEEDDMNTLEGK